MDYESIHVRIKSRWFYGLMQVISELTGLSLEQTCHGSLLAWWTKIFDNMHCSRPASNQSIQFDYQGGYVIEPVRGLYHDLKVVDVVSLYPSMAILNNISFDTVNCHCCVNRGDAKVSSVIIDKDYWICRQKQGAFPKKLIEFKQERIRQKQLGNEVKQLGLKILINGGYGLFGNPAFMYADIRVAELITSFGRHTLATMRKIASNCGFKVVGGDTDSLFLDGGDQNALQSLIAQCKDIIGVDVEHAETYVKAVLTKKKHYFGVKVAGTIKAVGMEGKKNDRPAWIRSAFDQFLLDFKAGVDVSVNLKATISDLENRRVNPDLLKITVKIAKDPCDYAINNPNKKVGALLGAKAGDVIWYFKTDAGTGGVTLNPDEVGIRKYKEMLMASVKDALVIMGYGSVEKIESEIFGITPTLTRKKAAPNSSLHTAKALSSLQSSD